MENLDLDLEIYDIWYKPFWNSKIIFIFCFFFILVLIIFIIMMRKKNKLITEKQFTIEDVLNNLYQLYKKIDDLNNKEFYCELISHLKCFALISYGNDLTAKTEKELINFLESKIGSKNEFRDFQELVNNALFNKFSHNNVSKIQMSADLKRSIELIKLFNNPIVAKD